MNKCKYCGKEHPTVGLVIPSCVDVLINQLRNQLHEAQSYRAKMASACYAGTATELQILTNCNCLLSERCLDLQNQLIELLGEDTLGTRFQELRRVTRFCGPSEICGALDAMESELNKLRSAQGKEE